MDLRAHQEPSLTMPIPLNYGSIHESSKFRMLSGSSHGHGHPCSSSLNGSLHSSSPVSRSSLAPAPPAPPASAPAPPPAPPSTADDQLLHSPSSAPAAPSGSCDPSISAAAEQMIIPAALASSSAGPGLPPSFASKKPVKYRECLKNHAANIGGHALDGCGEFMPSGEEGSLEALKCAACGCHRNFHRREAEGELLSSSCGFCYTPARSGMMKERRRFPPLAALPQHTPLALPPSPSVGPGAPPRTISQQGAALPLHMALHSPPDAGENSLLPQDLQLPPPHHHHSLMGAAMHHHFGHSSSMKKRFRTKFSSEQKDKMYAFAEKLGWRIQKHDESAVHQFCAEVGVKRHVFKVWMHNNKNTFSKKIPGEGGVPYLDNGGSTSPTSPTTSSGMQA